MIDSVTGMSSIKNIIDSIQESVDRLGGAAAKKQEPLFRELLSMLKRLETRGDVLLNNIKNLKIINEIKVKLEKLIIDGRYKDELKAFVQSYDNISQLHNQYFAQFNAAYKPAKGLNILRNTAIETTINNLTETGLQIGVTDGIRKILTTNVNAGGSYSELTEQLRNYMLTNDTGEGALERYVKTYANTAINQFSAEYNKSIADDLGLEWYMYDGSLLETSREFCEKCVKKKYIHVSEFPALLEGNFGDLGTIPLSKSTGLPNGMMKGTNPENFPRRRGGWNCGHQLIAVDDIVVPQNVKDKVYSSQAYKNWAQMNGKKPKDPSVQSENAKPSIQTNFFDKKVNLISKNFDSQTENRATNKSGLNYKEIVSLTGGIPKETISRIKHSLHVPNDDTIRSSIVTDQYQIERTIHHKEKWIYNDLMLVNETGGGIGLNLFLNQVKEAKGQGYKYLKVSAAGDFLSKEDWNGYITWGKFGYVQDDLYKQQFNKLMTQHGRSEKSLFDLVSSKEGLAFWEKYGRGWSGRFDLSDGSEAMNNLKKYLSDRKINFEL